MAGDPALLVQTLIYAGLDALRATTPLDLCAYLHAEADQGPQLYLGAPTLAAVEPSEAFNLFAALRDALDAEHEGEDTVALSGYEATLVSTSSERTRGLHVAGRLREPLEERERVAIVKLARALGEVIDAVSFPSAAPADAGLPMVVERVAVEMVDDGAHAEVGIAIGDEFRTGTATASTGARAVAIAAVDAVDAGIKIVEATEGNIGGSRVVLVLIEDGLGRQQIGSMLAGDDADPLRATAAAALDAAVRVTR